MNKKKFAELGFFSKHFNVPLESLTWGIKQETRKNCTDFSPCIIIRSTNLCIDILKGEIVSTIVLSPAFERSLYKASFNNKKMELETIAKIHNDETVIIEFSEEDLEIIYRYRWYDESLKNKFIP